MKTENVESNLTLSTYYDDELSENIKAVINSDMDENRKIRVIIGLCKCKEQSSNIWFPPTSTAYPVQYTCKREC